MQTNISVAGEYSMPQKLPQCVAYEVRFAVVFEVRFEHVLHGRGRRQVDAGREIYVHTPHYLCAYTALSMCIHHIIYVHTPHYLCAYTILSICIHHIIYVHTPHYLYAYTTLSTAALYAYTTLSTAAHTQCCKLAVHTVLL